MSKPSTKPDLTSTYKSLFNIGPRFRPMDLGDELQQLMTTKCNDCRLGVCSGRKSGFMWRGRLNAQVALIGQGPGPKEEEAGVPFVGPAGLLLDRWMLDYSGIPTSHCFVSNITHCMPNHEARGSYDPQPDEIDVCLPRLIRVLLAVDPEVIITFGWLAASALLGLPGGEKTYHGNWFRSSLLPRAPIFCMPHPSGVLRSEDPKTYLRAREALQHFQREYFEKKTFWQPGDPSYRGSIETPVAA